MLEVACSLDFRCLLEMAERLKHGDGAQHQT